jgi:hypothetical protein
VRLPSEERGKLQVLDSGKPLLGFWLPSPGRQAVMDIQSTGGMDAEFPLLVLRIFADPVVPNDLFRSSLLTLRYLKAFDRQSCNLV